jgi:hypothetical protein
MARWLKAYAIIATFGLIGLSATIGISVFASWGMETESPKILENISLSSRFTTLEHLDQFVDDPTSVNYQRAPESGLYLLTRAWIKELPAKNVLGFRAEFVKPEFLKGRQISVDGSFLSEASYHVQPFLEIGEPLTDEQKRVALTTTPILKVVHASVK